MVLRPALGDTRLFKVHGPIDAARITELPAGTAVNIAELQSELHRDLEPVVRDLKRRGGAAGVSSPAEDWVCQLVGAHLAATDASDA